jgi:hypothetical protein
LPYVPSSDEEYVLVAWSGNTGFKVGQKVPFTLGVGDGNVFVHRPG